MLSVQFQFLYYALITCKCNQRQMIYVLHIRIKKNILTKANDHTEKYVKINIMKLTLDLFQTFRRFQRISSSGCM